MLRTWTVALCALALMATHASAATHPSPGAPPSPAGTNRWGGPLAGVLPGLHWVSGAAPTASSLEGRVVIVEFWTFECVNCQRTLPAMKALTARYDSGGVVILGIHTPELPEEDDASNVRRAIEKAGIAYPVAQDNDYRVWNAFQNRYWPALYVLDGRGAVRYTHIGELHTGSAAWSTFVGKVDALRASPAR